MCGFVRARMSLAVVRSNTLLLCGARDKYAYIRQRPDPADGSVMALLAPWRGYKAKGIKSRSEKADDGQKS